MILDADGNPISPDRVSLRDLTFKELPQRMKFSFAAVSALIAAVAFLLSNIQTIKVAFSTPSPELSLEDTTVSDDGYAARLDMFVLNKGNANALITRAQIEVLEEVRMTGYNIEGAPMDIEVSYDVTLTLGRPDDSITSVPNFARVVKPNDADRISFNISTQDHDPDFLIAYKIRVILTYNDSTELTSPPVTIAGQMGRYAFDFDGEIPPKVKEQFPSILAKLDESGTEKGLVLSNMISKLKRLVAKG